jgi:DNA-binding GntR family transcriptional regulator
MMPPADVLVEDWMSSYVYPLGALRKDRALTVQLEPVSLTDSLSAALRSRIISGELAPGQKLTENWVATTFQVARPTAKAGMDRLTTEGLLRRGAHRSAVVPLLTRDDITDIYFSREVVEAQAVLTLTANRDSPGEARKHLREMELAAEDKRFLEHIEADIAFHRALIVATGSPRLKRMHETIMGETQLCIAQVQAHKDSDLVAIAREHAGILRAIRTGDPTKASNVLKRHLHGARDRLMSSLSSA